MSEKLTVPPRRDCLSLNEVAQSFSSPLAFRSHKKDARLPLHGCASLSVRVKECSTPLSVMRSYIFALGALLARPSLAYICTNLTVPVDLSARNGIFNLKAMQTNIDVTDFILENSRSEGNYTEQLLLNVRCPLLLQSIVLLIDCSTLPFRAHMSSQRRIVCLPMAPMCKSHQQYNS